MHFKILDVYMPLVSVLGDFGAVWIVTALIFIFQKRYRTVGITVLAAFILCGLIGNLGLKPLIARPRLYTVIPEIVLLIPRPTDYSFPSGHTMSAFAAATVIFRNNKRVGFCAFIFGILMAFSRLYLRVHYMTDILGGIAIGTVIGIMAVYLIKAINKRFQSI